MDSGAPTHQRYGLSVKMSLSSLLRGRFVKPRLGLDQGQSPTLALARSAARAAAGSSATTATAAGDGARRQTVLGRSAGRARPDCAGPASSALVPRRARRSRETSALASDAGTTTRWASGLVTAGVDPAGKAGAAESRAAAPAEIGGLGATWALGARAGLGPPTVITNATPPAAKRAASAANKSERPPAQSTLDQKGRRRVGFRG